MGNLTTFFGQPILAGVAAGLAIAADVPLSFWGGYDAETGEIIDQRHPLAGQRAAGRVLVIPTGRGSCSGSGVLLEAVRNGTAPIAIITSQIDPIIGLGGVLGDECYGVHPVLIVVSKRDRQRIANGNWVTVSRDGLVTVGQCSSDGRPDL